MFFKSKKKPTKPSKKQIEQYGNYIYAILSPSGDITLFDKLVCDAFTHFWMIEKSGQSKFLVANPIAKVDAIIATAYINALTFINGVNSSNIKQEYTKIFFKKNMQVICQEYPAFSPFISEMFSSRTELYNTVTEKYGSDLHAIINSVFEELQYVLSFDKEEKTYRPFTQSSQMVILTFNELMACQGEITAYKNAYKTLFGATNEQINRVLISLDNDASSANKNDIPIYYTVLQNVLLAGLEEYSQQHPSPILANFIQSLENYFSSFLFNTPSEEYSFSISVQNKYSMEYVDFNFEECVLEITCGGSVYSPDIGSDSYTNWFYSIWDDGSEENDSISIESFDIIYEILSSENAKISIDSPDKFYYYSDMEAAETKNTELQINIQDIISNNVIDIPSLWDMEPSHHGREVRIYGRLWHKQIDPLWCTLYAEHYRGSSVVDRVELKVNLAEPLPQFLWQKPRIYKTEIPMVGTLIYNSTNSSYGLIDAKYDEYWRDENGNILCRGLDCPHGCSEQCPIHSNNIAKTLVDKADYDGAISVLKKATEKTIDYTDNWLTLASCYLNLSMLEEAEDLYYKTLQLTPTNKQAIQELSIVSLRMGKFANAQKYAALSNHTKNDTQSLDLSQLIQKEILQFSNFWPSYNIPDSVWDSIRNDYTPVYWDMVLTQKLAHLALVESAVSTLEYKKEWQRLKSNRMEWNSVTEMRAALKENGINAEMMCIFDVIVAYEKNFIRY